MSESSLSFRSFWGCGSRSVPAFRGALFPPGPVLLPHRCCPILSVHFRCSVAFLRPHGATSAQPRRPGARRQQAKCQYFRLSTALTGNSVRTTLPVAPYTRVLQIKCPVQHFRLRCARINNMYGTSGCVSFPEVRRKKSSLRHFGADRKGGGKAERDGPLQDGGLRAAVPRLGRG